MSTMNKVNEQEVSDVSKLQKNDHNKSELQLEHINDNNNDEVR